MPSFSRRDVLLGGSSLLAAFAGLGQAARAISPGADAAAILAAAKGQTVYFNAWGGDQRINDYIAWAGGEVDARFGVVVRHVKLADTADAVNRILAEKGAGRGEGGSVDLIWINGENFATLKRADLLFGPINPLLGNLRFADTAKNPNLLRDFGLATEGYEAPWGKAQLVFFHDSARLPTPPRSLAGLLGWAEASPGRFTYPLPPDFIGTTFLKQIALQSVTGVDFVAPPPGAAAVLQPLWDYLDRLHPHLWRGARSFPKNSAELRQLLSDGEIDISMAFNPNDASSAIAQGLLPDSVRSFVLEGGSIGNTHFLAVPYNARAKEGALVFADFLLSPEAQLRKLDPAVWGDPTVLAMDLLPEAERARFAALPLGVATLPPALLGPILPEPHPDWVPFIESGWIARYGG